MSVVDNEHFTLARTLSERHDLEPKYEVATRLDRSQRLALPEHELHLFSTNVNSGFSSMRLNG